MEIGSVIFEMEGVEVHIIEGFPPAFEILGGFQPGGGGIGGVEAKDGFECFPEIECIPAFAENTPGPCVAGNRGEAPGEVVGHCALSVTFDLFHLEFIEHRHGLGVDIRHEAHIVEGLEGQE